MIYFISDTTGLVKIGYTNYSSAYGRLAELQHGNGRILEIACTLDNLGKDEEQRVHARFKRYRTIGEWFKLEGKLLEFFNWANQNQHAKSLPPQFFPIKDNRRTKRRKPSYAVTGKAKSRLAEERKWASKSGEVTVRKATPEELRRTN